MTEATIRASPTVSRLMRAELTRNIPTLTSPWNRSPRTRNSSASCLFTEAIRDALGESGRIKELRPDEAAERGCSSTLESYITGVRSSLLTLCTSAAKGGQLEVLEWLRENECPWDKNTCEAASGGHLEVPMWARENDCPWDENTCKEAACGGHLEVLQWARENGCPWDEETPGAVAQGGQTREALQWARENGCLWDENTCKEAACGGPSRCCSGRENGCPWDEDTCWPRRRAATSRCYSGRERTAARGTRRRAGRGAGYEGSYVERRKQSRDERARTAANRRTGTA